MDPIREQIELMTRRHFFGRTGPRPGHRRAGDAAGGERPGRGRADRQARRGQRGRRPARPAPLRPQGQAGHLPVHERRPVADGPVGLQAEDGRAVRQGPARLDPQGPAADHHDQRPDAVPDRAVEVQVRPARPGRARGSANCCPGRPRSSTTSPSIKTVNTEAINHDPAVTYICTGNQLPGRPSLGAWLSYGLGTMNQNLPAFVVMTATLVDARQPPRRSTTGSGARASCPASTRASRCAPAATRCCSCPTRPASTPPTRRRMLDAHRPAEPEASSSRSPTRRPRPASPSTRWPSACRPRCPS